MRFVFATVVLTSLLPLAALAEELPGVEPGKSIVQPLPEPKDGVATAEDGFVRVGDWDVKVSGSIIVDIGVGNIPPPRR